MGAGRTSHPERSQNTPGGRGPGSPVSELQIAEGGFRGPPPHGTQPLHKAGGSHPALALAHLPVASAWPPTCRPPICPALPAHPLATTPLRQPHGRFLVPTHEVQTPRCPGRVSTHPDHLGSPPLVCLTKLQNCQRTLNPSPTATCLSPPGLWLVGGEKARAWGRGLWAR